MKFIGILGLIVLGVIKNVTAGYTYTIEPTRGEIEICQITVLRVNQDDGNVLDLSYSAPITDDEPLRFTGKVLHYNPDQVVYDDDFILSYCDEADAFGSWIGVMIDLLTSDFLPPFDSAVCEVPAGTYVLEQNREIQGNFDDEIMCGDYQVQLNVTYREIPTFDVSFTFNIPDGDNCLKS